MERPLAILCTPLPEGTITELEHWRRTLEAALEPWLDARQLAHVRRFGPPSCGQAEERNGRRKVLRAALSRLFARAQLLTHAAERAPAQSAGMAAPLPQMSMDAQGRPLFPGWHAAFSHSDEAAFCALGPAVDAALAPHTLAPHALDAESLFSRPPAPNAFAPAETPTHGIGLSQQAISHEALRRWTIKEALLKASGLGLGMNPASIPTGGFGQRAGIWRGPLGVFYWRGLPCPGHWLCVAWQMEEKTDFRPNIFRPFFLWRSPHTLLRGLAALRPRG